MEEEEFGDLEELLDFDNLPSFKKKGEGIKFWRKKAQGLKYWCLKYREELEQVRNGNKEDKNQDKIPSLVNGDVGENGHDEVVEEEDLDTSLTSNRSIPSPAATVFIPRRKQTIVHLEDESDYDSDVDFVPSNKKKKDKQSGPTPTVVEIRNKEVKVEKDKGKKKGDDHPSKDDDKLQSISDREDASASEDDKPTKKEKPSGKKLPSVPLPSMSPLSKDDDLDADAVKASDEEEENDKEKAGKKDNKGRKSFRWNELKKLPIIPRDRINLINKVAKQITISDSEDEKLLDDDIIPLPLPAEKDQQKSSNKKNKDSKRETVSESEKFEKSEQPKSPSPIRISKSRSPSPVRISQSRSPSTIRISQSRSPSPVPFPKTKSKINLPNVKESLKENKKKGTKKRPVILSDSDDTDFEDQLQPPPPSKTETPQKNAANSSPRVHSELTEIILPPGAPKSDVELDEQETQALVTGPEKAPSPELKEPVIAVREIQDNEKPGSSKQLVKEMQKKKKISQHERDAKKSVLDTSSEGEDEEKEARIKARKERKKDTSLKETSFKEVDIDTDPKLKARAVVKLQRLAAAIQAELKKSHGTMVIPSSEGEDDIDSDSSIGRLDKAIRSLAKYNAVVAAERRVRKKREKKTRRSRKISDSEEEEKRVSDVADDSDAGKPLIRLRSLRDILDESQLSDMEDLEGAEDDDSGRKKKDASGSKTDGGKNYKVPRVKLTSDDSGKDDVFSSDDSDDDFKKSKSKFKSSSSKKRSKKHSESSSLVSDGSDFDSRKKKPPKNKKRLKIESESDAGKKRSDSSVQEVDSDGWISTDKKRVTTTKRVRKDLSSSVKSGSSSSTDFGDSDEDKKKKNKKKKDKKKKLSPKKKRRRIRNSSDESNSSDSDVKVLSGSDQEDGKGSGGRKNIRKIMSKNDLTKTTREAEKEEEERRKRVQEWQKQYNGTFDTGLAENGKVKEVILEWDRETKEPIISVDESIVAQLKPHQAEGIKFMYNSCFESLEIMKRKKGGGCILAHCMGLGKTLQTIAFTYTMWEQRHLTQTQRILIVCPLNTVGNWLKEYRMWLEDVDKQPPYHDLWEAKNMSQRVDALRCWKQRGGVAIVNYEMFRMLVNAAVPPPPGRGQAKAKTKQTKIKASHKEIIEETLLDPGPDIVVCDEGHLLKNHKSKLTQSLSLIKTLRRIVLTGTPLQNNLVEYHTMVEFVKPNLLGTLKEFTNRFVNPIKNGQHKDSDDHDVRLMKRRAHVLHSKLAGCVQRLDYSVLTPYLAPKFEYCIVIRLSEKQKALYRDYLHREVEPEMGNMSTIGQRILQHYAYLIKIVAHPIALTMKRRETSSDEEEEGSLKDFICDSDEEGSKTTTPAESNSDLECLDDDKLPKPKRKTRNTKVEDEDESSNLSLGKAKSWGSNWYCSHFENREEMEDLTLSGKLVVLQEILRVCESIGDRVLVFSQFITTLDIVERSLEYWDEEAAKKQGNVQLEFPRNLNPQLGRWRKGIEYFRIDGQTKTNDRQKHCEKFNKKTASNAKLFLISTKAGGLGINLFGANRVIIFDASWNPSNDMQGIFRAYRFGQTKPVYIYRFVAQATIEEKIYNRQVVKLSLSSRVVDEHQVERHFKFDDIHEMLRYNPDETIERPTPPVPKDTLLLKLLDSHKEWIERFFEHDSLLLNKEDETLTEEEKRQAWDEYRNANERTIIPPQLQQATIPVQDQTTYFQIVMKIRAKFPTATEEQINSSSIVIYQKFQELRVIIQRLNAELNMPAKERLELTSKSNRIQTWIAQALDGPGPTQTGNNNATINPQMTGYAVGNGTAPIQRSSILRRNVPQTGDVQRQMTEQAARQLLQGVNRIVQNPYARRQQGLPGILRTVTTVPRPTATLRLNQSGLQVPGLNPALQAYYNGQYNQPALSTPGNQRERELEEFVDRL